MNTENTEKHRKKQTSERPDITGERGTYFCPKCLSMTKSAREGMKNYEIIVE